VLAEAHESGSSANILRGPVEAANFKTYIFSLPFFMRICAVHQAATVL
jgi:hypothetical protein